jgi:iron complex transport system substrate-binding protein
MIKKLMGLLTILIVAIGICGCMEQTSVEKPTNKGEESIKIVDAVGREVEVPKEVNKVIALSCTLREVVYLLQDKAPEKVVGIESRESTKVRGGEGKWPAGLDLPYITAYPELQEKPPVRAGKTLNLEKIVELKPDVIFVGPWSADEADKIQQKTGIPVVVVYVGSVGTKEQLERYYKSLRLMGKILGEEERAEELIKIMNSYIADLNQRTKDIPDDKKPTVYIAGRAYYGAHGILATDPHWPPFEWVHAKNVAFKVKNESTGLSIDKEALVRWNPDIIFVSSVSLPFIVEDIKKDPAYKSLKAVKEGNIYVVMPYCWYAYNKEIGIVDAYFVGKTLYPDRFEDIDIDKKGEEIFEKFLGKGGKEAYHKLKERYKAFEKISLE